MKVRTVSPLLVGILVLLCASPFLATGGYGLYRDVKFDENVGRTTATIEQLSRTSGGQGKGWRYEVNYGYKTGNDGDHNVTSRVAPSTYYRLHRGDEVPIKFLSEEADESRIDWPVEDEWNWQHDEIGLEVGLFFAAIGLFLAWLGRPRDVR